MAKHLKLTIKNTQIAKAINLGSVKDKLAKKKEASETSEKASALKAKGPALPKAEEEELKPKEETPRIKARSKSAFAEGAVPEHKAKIAHEEPAREEGFGEHAHETREEQRRKGKTSEELRKEIFGDVLEERQAQSQEEEKPQQQAEAAEQLSASEEIQQHSAPMQPSVQPELKVPAQPSEAPKPIAAPPRERLGPTGRHIKDLYPVKPRQPEPVKNQPATSRAPAATQEESAAKKGKVKGKEKDVDAVEEDSEAAKKGIKSPKVKEFRDIKPVKKLDTSRSFDARDRQGLRDTEEEQRWRKKRPKHKVVQEDTTIRPTTLKVRIPISIKDLASEMKLKASQLIAKLFMQGLTATLNDLLEDETTIQLLGHEFGCEITIDVSEEQRIRITDKTVKEEIASSPSEELQLRPPVVAFMGHVDHGKTSLIDTIRKSNRAAGEAGAITQHIGAFRCQTAVGDIAILDTPGHEAFSAMRARGADVTDIVVLVVAGDEGIRQQTVEAIQHAKAAGVNIVVAINKCDKPNFNAENVYRQLADNELLPETWGGQTITVNCSAVTGQGIPELLEMLALQAEVLELRANPHSRARGRVLESEMHKGMGSVATVLVQNGTLRLGDSVVFDQLWGRIKTMQDEFGQQLQEAPPSTPVEITGLSGLPEAGQEFIVVKNEREAREIAEARMQGIRQTNLQLKKKLTMENLVQQASEPIKKTLNLIIRADVQGSVEALRVALMKIESKKADLNIIFAGVGEVSESDVQLAAASKAVIVGFHTQIESHADALVKQLGVQVRMHDIIYHAIDDVKAVMAGLLDRIAQETEKGKALVKTTFKSSQYGIIAGCAVTEGAINRNNHIRVVRSGDVVWKGPISSLKRVKEDVREVQKGLECGIVLNGFNQFQEGDVLEAFEITYITQEL